MLLGAAEVLTGVVSVCRQNALRLAKRHNRYVGLISPAGAAALCVQAALLIVVVI
jgi:hypothetical protein